MRTEKNILVAFLLNLSFAIFEFFGGVFTNSIAIISDSIHDIGDSLSIGVSYFLEKKSKRKPDDKYTYGYMRYSILGAVLTTIILIVGSVFVIINSIKRVINPVDINYDGMIVFAIIGVVVNFLAAYFTKDGDSLNQKAVNLHMAEDVLGWIVVLIGAVVMRFTDIKILDPIMSILVSLFILKNSLANFKETVDLFLEKTPHDISLDDVKNHILEISNVLNVHHIHIWSIDGVNNYATMHVVVEKLDTKIKDNIREELKEFGISHVTIELEKKGEVCDDLNCHPSNYNLKHHHHHHH